MSFKVLAIFSVWITFCTSYYVEVELYQNGGCNGWVQEDNMDYECVTYPNLGNDISGLFMPIGSCLKFHTGVECSGSTYMLAYPEYDLCDLPCCGWNDNIWSVEDCDTRETIIECPNGTYVREITFEENDPKKGFTIYCYEATATEFNYSYNTHGLNSNLPQKTKCPIAAHGIVGGFEDDWQLWHSLQLICSPPFISMTNNNRQYPKLKRNSTISKSKTLESILIHKPLNFLGKNIPDKYNLLKQDGNYCEGIHSAITGLRVTIDEADVVKEWFYYCGDVPNPAVLCEPLENLTTVFICDNLNSGNEFECTFSKTVGVGKSKTMTETERKEMEFSVEFGYNIGVTLDFLSESMSVTLRESELVAYEWSKSDTTTWSVEDTFSATIKVRPHTVSKLEQLTGKCSFYGVNVNYFKQTDIGPNGTTIHYFRDEQLYH